MLSKTGYFFAALVILLSSLASKADDFLYPQLSNLPTLYIETENKASIPDKNSNYLKAVIRLVKDDEITVYDKLGIRGRGNSTWNLEKKPYRIKFDSKQSFLGPERANAKSWTLLANHSDKTLMRNAVAACIGDFAGQPFTAAAQFVDVVLNGNYIGNYQISDQMEIRKKRVDITEQEEGLDESQNITGGYFLEVDGFAYQEKSYFITDRGVLITIKSPDEDIISKAQADYIRNYINSFEAALFSKNFKDPETGYRPFVDESTLASWYISSELTGNVDCFWSTYIYKDKDDPKIYWGPLWDYDIAFNNCIRKGPVTNSLMSNIAFGDDLTKLWIRQMWKDPWFGNMINDKWKKLVEEGIEEHIINFIDETALLLEESQTLNFGKWLIDQRAYDELVLFSTYWEGVNYLKQFITQHISFLTIAFRNAAEATGDPKPFVADQEYCYIISNKGTGKMADVDDSQGLCIWGLSDDRNDQHWRFVSDGKDHYQIINCNSGLAVSETAVMTGNTYSVGNQLELKKPDMQDLRQLWTITPTSNEAGMGMVIENLLSGNSWNNNGGWDYDGNFIISWYSDSENPSKPNRQWYINPVHEIENCDKIDTGGVDIIENPQPEYYITYEKVNRILHFRAPEGCRLEGNASILSMEGKEMMKFRPEEDIDISFLKDDFYILIWEINGQKRSLKFHK